MSVCHELSQGFGSLCCYSDAHISFVPVAMKKQRYKGPGSGTVLVEKPGLGKTLDLPEDWVSLNY